ncbi:MAG TPA: N-acetylmuramoyl-L-alanine amidase [Clostridia bacterium]|nr:N-acetylmuramoyl-L-alanine amidase [Clostridia bacterium]
MKKGLLTAMVACTVTVSSFVTINAAPAVANQNIVPSNARIVVNGKPINPERNIVAENNRLLVPARTTLKELGASVDWYENTGIIRIKKDAVSILMKIGETEASVNGVGKDTGASPILINGTVMVPLRFTAEALHTNVKWDGSTATAFVGSIPATTGTSTSRGGDDFRGRIVVIDAGHGGSESGAVEEGLQEKNFNLDIAKRLNTLLASAGIKTYMTRTDDSYVDLYDRSGLANKVNADLFISIHNNAVDNNSSVAGSMTLYYPSNDRAKNGVTPKGLATIVQNELTSSLGTKDLGIISRPNLAVLRTTNMPAIIAEIGYMTNHNELLRLESSDFRQQSAAALSKAVQKVLLAMR